MISFETATAAREKLDKIYTQIGGTAFYLRSGLFYLSTQDGWAIKVYATPSAVLGVDIPSSKDGVPVFLATTQPQVVMQGRGDRK